MHQYVCVDVLYVRCVGRECVCILCVRVHVFVRFFFHKSDLMGNVRVIFFVCVKKQHSFDCVCAMV